MTLQGIPLAWSRIRNLWQLAGSMAVTGNLTVDGTLTVGGSASTSLAAERMPSDHGLIAWPYKPEIAVTTLTPVLGTVYLTAIPIRQAATISKIWFLEGTAAVTPTAGQNWCGLYNSSGTLLSSGSLDSVITTGNTSRNGTLATPQAVSAGMYWAALVFNCATAPVIYKTNQPFLGFSNINQSPASYAYAINGTSQTTLSNITPAGNAAGQSIWMGVS